MSENCKPTELLRVQNPTDGMTNDYYEVDMSKELLRLPFLADNELKTLISLSASLLKKVGQPQYTEGCIAIRPLYSNPKDLNKLTSGTPCRLHVDFNTVSRQTFFNLSFKTIDTIKEEAKCRGSKALRQYIGDNLMNLAVVRERDEVIATEITEQVIKNLQLSN